MKIRTSSPFTLLSFIAVFTIAAFQSGVNAEELREDIQPIHGYSIEILREACAYPDVVEAAGSATLNVRASQVEDKAIDYDWTKVSGPGDVSFGSPREPQSCATFSETGIYVLRVTLKDGQDEKVSEVTVEVDGESPAVAEESDKEDPATCALTVNSGSGSGEYKEGTIIPVTAAPAPTGKEFYRWDGDVTALADPGNECTAIEIYSSALTVTALYRDVPATGHRVAIFSPPVSDSSVLGAVVIDLGSSE